MNISAEELNNATDRIVSSNKANTERLISANKENALELIAYKQKEKTGEYSERARDFAFYSFLGAALFGGFFLVLYEVIIKAIAAAP